MRSEGPSVETEYSFSEEQGSLRTGGWRLGGWAGEKSSSLVVASALPLEDGFALDVELKSSQGSHTSIITTFWSDAVQSLEPW